MANQTLQLARLLTDEGMQVEMVQVNAPYKPAWAGRIKGLRALIRLFPYLARLWRASGRADVVHLMANSGWSWHLFSAPAIWVASLRGKPVLVNYRGGYAQDFLQRQAGIVGFSMRRAARLVVPSDFLKKVFAGFSMSADVLPNVVDVERFRPAVDGDRDKPPAILVARNLEAIYDNATAIRAFATVHRELPEAKMIIAGSGPEETALKQLAKSLGLSQAIEFTGRVDAANMPALYARASVALNPSRVDNMPNSILEALAAKVPVVSTNVGGVPYIVRQEETALLVPAGDDEAMAESLLRILRDQRLADNLVEAGYLAAREYAWDKVRDRLFDLYESLAREPGIKLAHRVESGVKQ
jgi:glycosyltransferase involved in cell wall biosynthesis